MSDLFVILENARFEKTVLSAFQAIGYETKSEELSRQHKYIGDFVAQNSEGLRYVEVKFYTQRSHSLQHLRRAIDAFKDRLKKDQDAKGILVINYTISTEEFLELPVGYSNFVEVWSISDLIDKLSENITLVDKLLEFGLNTSGNLVPKSSKIKIIFDKSKNDSDKHIVETLKNELKERKDWREFEIVCSKILKLIFREDLDNWVAQNSSDNRLHVRDLTARILGRATTHSNKSTTEDFWSILARHFNCRYITFEFKDYGSPISQGEVLTTEKYLYLTALRSVAIIIAANGADKNAIETMKGALREHGKLILMISPENLDTMLDLWLDGDLPQRTLLEKLDERLLNINR